MDDIVILEAADHMDDGVHLPDMGKELIAQAFAFISAPHQAGDVHEFDGGRGILFRVIHFGQYIQPVVGYSHHPHIGFDGAEGIVGRLGPRLGNGVKQGAFAHVWQADNA